MTDKHTSALRTYLPFLVVAALVMAAGVLVSEAVAPDKDAVHGTEDPYDTVVMVNPYDEVAFAEALMDRAMSPNPFFPHGSFRVF